MSSSLVSTRSASYLKAMAQRGDLAVKPETLALGKGIDLHHRAVGLISEIVPDFVELVDRAQEFLPPNRPATKPSLHGSPSFLSRGKSSECFCSSTPSTAPVP